MKPEQLAALTPTERQFAEAAQLDPGKVFAGEDVLPVLAALADARLDVARLREERARARDLLHQCRGNLTLGALRPTLPLWEAIDTYLREELEQAKDSAAWEKYDARS